MATQPVLHVVSPMWPSPEHPHIAHRGTFTEVAGLTQPAPAPRFSRTGAEIRHAAASIGEHSEEILREFGFSEEEIEARIASGAVHCHSP